jgi:hypothetical protein
MSLRILLNGLLKRRERAVGLQEVDFFLFDHLQLGVNVAQAVEGLQLIGKGFWLLTLPTENVLLQEILGQFLVLGILLCFTPSLLHLRFKQPVAQVLFHFCEG